MPDDIKPPNGSGRTINTYDLEIFAGKVENRFDRVDDKLDRSDYWQSERDLRIDSNTAAIKDLHDWKQEIASQPSFTPDEHAALVNLVKSMAASSLAQQKLRGDIRMTLILIIGTALLSPIGVLIAQHVWGH